MANKPNNKKATQQSDWPTLDESFRYALEKRRSVGGIAQAALGGDRDALKSFAGSAVVFVERAAATDSQSAFVELAEWLAYALSRIQAGDEPNEAFGWARRGKGRPAATQKDFPALMKRWVVGQHIAGLLANDLKLTDAEAYRVAAKEHHVSEEAARDIWSQWQGRKPVK